MDEDVRVSSGTANDAVQGQSSPRTLARDVAINTVANLLAAAILYLGAVALGILAPIRVAVFVAFLVISLVLSAGLWSVGAFSNNYTQSVNGKKGFLIVGAALAVAMIGFFTAHAPFAVFVVLTQLQITALVAFAVLWLIGRTKSDEKFRDLGRSHAEIIIRVLVIFIASYLLAS